MNYIFSLAELSTPSQEFKPLSANANLNPQNDSINIVRKVSKWYGGGD